jgi:isoquinoline 1-oxidoreductase alpha subunit
MSAAALLEQNPNPSEEQVDQAMAGNICRCGCYPRIKKAILSAAEQPTGEPDAVASSGLAKEVFL